MSSVALVTGACGFVGSHMVELLLEKGCRVLATDHPAADPSALPSPAEFIPADLTQPESLRPILSRSFQKVFHIAAIFDYSAPWRKLWEVNCLGTENLLRQLTVKKGELQSIVVWSSGSIYGNNFRKEALKETEPPAPKNNYERSKLLQEEIALAFCQREKLPIAVIRPSAIYGPRSRYGLAVPVFLMRKGLLKMIPGDGQAIGGYIHVRDVAGAAEFLSNQKEAVGQVYNLTDDNTTTIENSFFHVAKTLGVRLYPIHIPMPLIRAAAWLDQTVCRLLGKRPTLEPDFVEYLSQDFWMDNAKLKALGYRFEFPDFKVGLEQTIRWYRENRWL
ncbi:MAG: NAD-dependent epimerase/dehydratase family protein [Elusimicrobia bacterium]|nr:NAD-dependent epimerase/dehydratase family protein [Elusimicrobiota bacterium]